MKFIKSLVIGLLVGSLASSAFAGFSLYKPVRGLVVSGTSSTSPIGLLNYTLPAGVVNQPYSFNFTNLAVTSGSRSDLANAVWMVLNGDLPEGLALSSSGVLSGIPSVVANNPVTVRVSLNGSEASKTYTIEIDGAPAFQATHVAAGEYHTCALTTTNQVKCWGRNDKGELGTGTTTYSNVPVYVSGLASDITMLAVGSRHNCAYSPSQGLKCWGRGDYGQLGGGNSPTFKTTPVSVFNLPKDLTLITAGVLHTCAVSASQGMKCWGDNSSGQVGAVEKYSSYNTPQSVAGLNTTSIFNISANLANTCVILGSRKLKCWGNNGTGQVGNGNYTDQFFPTDVVNIPSDVSMVSVGYTHTCAVSDSQGLKCWGLNGNGQLGVGDTITRNKPTNVFASLPQVINLSAGGYATCAIVATGETYCWGSGAGGQYATTSNSNYPVLNTALPAGISQISLGMYHGCGMATGGTYCWGTGSTGQLGNGSSTFSLTPVPVLP